MIHHLRVWRHVVKWVNDGRGSSNRVTLDGFEDTKETNDLSETTKTHLREITKQKAVNTAIRNLLHAEDNQVKGKLDEMHQAHRGAIVTEQPKFKMILGVTSLGRRKRWKKNKKNKKNPEKVNSANKGCWRDALMDDVVAASQQWQCWEMQQKIVDQTTTEANETKEVNLITVALLKAMARKGETVCKAFNTLGNVSGTHNHRIDD